MSQRLNKVIVGASIGALVILLLTQFYLLRDMERPTTLDYILAVLSFVLLTVLIIWILIRVFRLIKDKGALQEYIDNLRHMIEFPVSTIENASADQLRAIAKNESLDVKRLASYIHSQAARIKQIVDHMDDKTLEDLRKNLNIRSIVLKTLFEHCVQDMEIKYPDMKNEIHVDVYPPDLSLECDPYYLKTALLNVLDNSFHYNRETKDLYVEISASVAIEEVQIRIADNGVGLEHEELNKIGRKYYRPEQHKDRDGIGIGLYQVIQIAKAHHGRVKFYGDTTAGFSVEIRMPLDTSKLVETEA